MNWMLTIACFLLGTLSTNAQQLIFKSYTIEDGLVSNPVRRIYQDSRGFLWIGTWEGLSKYDGNKFTNYTTASGLSHNMINDIYESADGKLYVAQNDGTTDILHKDAIVKKAAFKNVIINKFYIARNKKIFVATDTSGLYEIKNGSLIKLPQPFPHFTFSDITELNDSLLIGGASTLRILNRRYDLFSEIKFTKNDFVSKIYKDSKNRIWIGTNYGLKLLISLQKNDQRYGFSLLPAPFKIAALKSSTINDILEDADGNIWIATRHGLVKIQPNNALQLFLEKDGLPSDEITCLYQDREKNIWIGTSQGLAKLITRAHIRIYSVENGLKSNDVNFLLPLNKEKLLISTQKSIQLYNISDGVFSSVRSPHNIFFGFVPGSRPLLLYSASNVFGKYDSINHVIKKIILPNPPPGEILCAVMDTNGITFYGTWTGLYVHHREKSQTKKILTHRIANMLIDKKGFLWVGSWHNGLFRIKYTIVNNNLKVTTVKDFSHLLPDKNIRSLFEDSNGNIWIGTRYQGMVQLRSNNDKNNDGYVSRQFNVETGLSSNWIRAMAEDSKGSIWIGSILGIDKLIPERNTFRVINFSRINNFFATINAILPLDNQALWFATTQGVVNITNNETEDNQSLPVYITTVKLSDTSFNYNNHQADKKVNLKYTQNQAEFEFSSPGFINEKQILYSYRLTGSADTSWSKPANVHNVSYASLKPGNYTFEVRTIGWNGQFGASEKFTFSISPPYWKTWWFYLLAGIVVILILYGFYLYRIRQLLKLQKVRNRIASDLHDDIGATLTNINMLSEISRKNLAHPQEAEKFLKRITEEVTATSQALNDIIWSANTGNDSIQETIYRMRRYAAELFDNSDIALHLNMNENIAGKKINMEQRRDVYLIYKELMNNIVKHASANNVWVDIFWQNRKLHMKIKDDGNGFDATVASKGNGLKNIRSRTQKWKSSTTIKTLPGKGTLIEIIIPLRD